MACPLLFTNIFSEKLDIVFVLWYYYIPDAEIAQSVEQRTENPCVGSSILPLGIFFLSQ